MAGLTNGDIACEQAYQNERNAPEILEYQEALVTRVEGLVADRVCCECTPLLSQTITRTVILGSTGRECRRAQESLMVSYEQDRERSFLISMMNFDLVRGAIYSKSLVLPDAMTPACAHASHTRGWLTRCLPQCVVFCACTGGCGFGRSRSTS